MRETTAGFVGWVKADPTLVPLIVIACAIWWTILSYLVAVF